MTESKRFLFRGENAELYKNNGGKLIPKSTEAFLFAFKYGNPDFKYGSGGSYGISPANAVLGHQIGSRKYPTSGISTSTHFKRAYHYAISGGEVETGYIFKIDRELLDSYDVKEWLVSQYVTHPAIPKDDEVILVSSEFGILPADIVVEIIPVSISLICRIYRQAIKRREKAHPSHTE